jgi:hypothetical protein
MVDLYLFRLALRDLLRPKRLSIALLLSVLPAGIALLLRLAGPERFDSAVAYNSLASTIVYGFLLVILSLVFCTGVITQEMEQKTIVYLLTRPVARWRIVLIKYLAAVLGISLMLAAATLLLAAATIWTGPAGSTALLMSDDVTDARGFYETVKARGDPISEFIYERLGGRLQAAMADPRYNEEVPQRILDRFVARVSSRLRTARLYSRERFGGIPLPPETVRLAESRPTGRSLVRLNRQLLEAAYPDFIRKAEPVQAPIARDLLVLPIGALAYGALFLLLATLLRKPMMVGILFAFGWESWAPNLPGKFQYVSIMTYLRVLAPHPRPPAESTPLLQFLSGANQEVLAETTARLAIGGITLVALLAALVLFSVREFVPRDDVE